MKRHVKMMGLMTAAVLAAGESRVRTAENLALAFIMLQDKGNNGIIFIHR